MIEIKLKKYRRRSLAMMLCVAAPCVFMCYGLRLNNESKNKILYQNDFQDSATEADFVLEGKGDYEIRSGELFIDDSGTDPSGLTLWLDRMFKGDVRITYDAKVVAPELRNNINFFFMAKGTNDQSVIGMEHNGQYGPYHKDCKMYIFTFTDRWSRLRKDPDFNLISERMDLKAEFDKVYNIEILKNGETIQVKLDGKVIHSVEDKNPYEQGSLGFRTWRTHLSVDNFKIYALE